MYEENLKRMIKLAEQFFENKNDPSQISITPEIIGKLRKIHPKAVTEKKNDKGPIAWIVLIPATEEMMKKFISKKITEPELLEQTLKSKKYDTLYLCSALVLPEYRGKGLAKNLIYRAINSMRKKYPIRSLFYWAFSTEGKKLANSVAREFHLPLYQRKV